MNIRQRGTARTARKAAAVATASLAVLALAACGSSDSSSTGSTSGGASTQEAAGGANVAASQQLLDKYSQEPAFVAPGDPFDAKKEMAGKKVMSIPVSSEIPLTQVITKAQADAAKKVGFTFTHWQNQGKSDQWVQGINTAIAQKYDAIDLLGIDPKLVKPQLEKARSAGVKVVSTHLAGFGTPVPDYVDGAVRLPYYEVGTLLAAQAIVSTDGKADALAIVAEDLSSTADVVKGMQDEFAKNCPDCKLKTANVPTTQWATGVKTEVSSGIQRNPNLNYVIPIYDAMSQFAHSGLQVAGKAGKIGMATFNGTPFALEMVANGQLEMNLGENEVWIALAMLDADMRAATGQTVPENDYDKAPLLVFTKDNVANAGTPPTASDGYGDGYVAGFDELWGLSK
jgi:ribose transport system substrate-binding protein